MNGTKANPEMVDGTYKLKVYDNGNIDVYHQDKLIHSQTINNIDKNQPDLEISQSVDRVTISVSDGQSGPDMESIVLQDTSGLATDFSRKGNQISFTKHNDHDQLQIRLADKANHEVEGIIKVNEIEVKD